VSDRLPWERQYNESRQAFQAFATYRDQGPTRSLSRVSQELHKDRVLLGRWSRKWRWVERAQAWDDEQDRVHRESMAEAIREMNREHALVGRAMVVKASKAIEAGAKPGKAEIPRWVAEGVKTQRLALGVPDQIVQELADPEELDQRERLNREQGMLFVQALRGILIELGVADLPQTPAVVRRHLMLVAGDDDEKDEENEE
jgi:hypothetical protein